MDQPALPESRDSNGLWIPTDPPISHLPQLPNEDSEMQTDLQVDGGAQKEQEEDRNEIQSPNPPVSTVPEELGEQPKELYSQILDRLDKIETALSRQEKAAAGSSNIQSQLHDRLYTLEELNVKGIKQDVDHIYDGLDKGTLFSIHPEISSRISILEQQFSNSNVSSRLQNVESGLGDLDSKVDKALSTSKSSRMKQNENIDKSMARIEDLMGQVESLAAKTKNAVTSDGTLLDPEKKHGLSVNDRIDKLEEAMETQKNRLSMAMKNSKDSKKTQNELIEKVQKDIETLEKKLEKLEQATKKHEDVDGSIGHLRLQVGCLNAALAQEKMAREAADGRVKTLAAMWRAEQQIQQHKISQVLTTPSLAPDEIAKAMEETVTQQEQTRRWANTLGKARTKEDLSPFKRIIKRMKQGESLPAHIPTFDDCGTRLEGIIKMLERDLPSMAYQDKVMSSKLAYEGGEIEYPPVRPTTRDISPTQAPISLQSTSEDTKHPAFEESLSVPASPATEEYHSASQDVVEDHPLAGIKNEADAIQGATTTAPNSPEHTLSPGSGRTDKTVVPEHKIVKLKIKAPDVFFKKLGADQQLLQDQSKHTDTSDETSAGGQKTEASPTKHDDFTLAPEFADDEAAAGTINVIKQGAPAPNQDDDFNGQEGSDASAKQPSASPTDIMAVAGNDIVPDLVMQSAEPLDGQGTAPAIEDTQAAPQAKDTTPASESRAGHTNRSPSMNLDGRMAGLYDGTSSPRTARKRSATEDSNEERPPTKKKKSSAWSWLGLGE